MSVRLFVGNINYSATEEQVKGAFAAVAGVTAVQIIRDKHTGHSRGFGFVEVMTDEDAQRAISEFHGAKLFDKILRVEVAAQQGNRRR